MEEKAEGEDNYVAHVHMLEQPKAETNSTELQWSAKRLGHLDPVMPNYLEEEAQMDGMEYGEDAPFRDIIKEVKMKDKKRDHSKEALTEEEKTEMALFQSIKTDPYYKHYLYNHLIHYGELLED